MWMYPLIEKEIVMKRTRSNRTLARQAGTSAVSLALGALVIGGSMSAAAAPREELKFDMAVAGAAQACLPNAKAQVTVRDVSGGIFSSELFVFAPAVRTAPPTDPFDALTNPATAPVHTYHLGLWFSDPADAAAAGCPGTVTPFEGNHQAGIQVFNTSNFGTEAATGPLSQF
jgi:hypothetical protein